MYVLNVTDYDDMTDDYNDSLSINKNCTLNENSIDIFVPVLLFTIPCGQSFLCLISFMVYILIKILFKKKKKFLFPFHPVRCIKTGASECGKFVFLTKFVLNIINEYDKIYIYSPSLHQDLYQKLTKCFNNYIPTDKIPNNLNEEDIDVVNDEIVNN